MNENSPGEGLHLRLELGKQAPDLIFTVDQGEDGTVVEGVLDGLKDPDELVKNATAIIARELPVDLLPNEVIKRLAEQFRECYGELLEISPDYN